MSKKQSQNGKTCWDFLAEIRPRNLRFFHWSGIAIFITTCLAIYSNNNEGNMFYYLRRLITRLYQDQNVFATALIVVCILLLCMIFLLKHRIDYVYKPEIERLKGRGAEVAKKGQALFLETAEAVSSHKAVE